MASIGDLCFYMREKIFAHLTIRDKLLLRSVSTVWKFELELNLSRNVRIASNSVQQFSQKRGFPLIQLRNDSMVDNLNTINIESSKYIDLILNYLPNVREISFVGLKFDRESCLKLIQLFDKLSGQVNSVHFIDCVIVHDESVEKLGRFVSRLYDISRSIGTELTQFSFLYNTNMDTVLINVLKRSKKISNLVIGGLETDYSLISSQLTKLVSLELIESNYLNSDSVQAYLTAVFAQCPKLSELILRDLSDRVLGRSMFDLRFLVGLSSIRLNRLIINRLITVNVFKELNHLKLIQEKAKYFPEYMNFMGSNSTNYKTIRLQFKPDLTKDFEIISDQSEDEDVVDVNSNREGTKKLIIINVKSNGNQLSSVIQFEINYLNINVFLTFLEILTKLNYCDDFFGLRLADTVNFDSIVKNPYSLYC